MPQLTHAKSIARNPALLFLLLPFFGGCIHLEQTIRLHRNGSAVVSYHYSVAEETLAALMNGRRAIVARQHGETGDGMLDWFTNEAAVRRHFVGDGLEVRRYRAHHQDGRLHVEIEVEARDALRAFRAGCFGALTLRFASGGDIELLSTLPVSAAPAKESAKAGRRLQTIYDDLWLRLTVIAPADIIATSGKTKGKRTAVWTFAPETEGKKTLSTAAIMVRFAAEGPAWKTKNATGAAE